MGSGMGGGGGSQILVVPQSKMALDQLKHEVAAELGIAIPQDGYYGHYASRDCGAMGGHMVRRMVQLAEQVLAEGYTPKQ